MIPVYGMVNDYDPERRIFGDCFSAALASLMELPLAEVPHFVKHAELDTVLFAKDVSRWLASRGFVLIPATWFNFKDNNFACSGACYHLLFGMCDAGKYGRVGHTVVALNGVVVHDPNPENPAMVDDLKDRCFGFLVKAA